MNSVASSPLMSLSPEPQPQAVAKARELKGAFSTFVGEAFYGQMLKSMRSTVGKPAYFHGGQAEETFRSQLDQQLAQELAEDTGDQFAGPMFAQQFPDQAKLLERAGSAPQADFTQLEALRRR
jgi:peptidoglycan hydrolase FlgJ